MNVALFSDPIPKNSRFAINDWILKNSGFRSNKIAKIIGYRKAYYGGGDYLIEFEDGHIFKTKKKYFRGPFKTKEIAIKFEQNPDAEETPNEVKLKPNDVRTKYKTLPKTEQELKSIFTKAPYNFTWLDVPITIPSVQLDQTDITILATKKNNPIKTLKVPYEINLRRDDSYYNCIIRYNNRLTKNLTSSDWSPYQIYYPNRNSHLNTIQNWNFNESAISQADKLFKIDKMSYKQFKTQMTDRIPLSQKFENFNKFLQHEKLTPRLLIEIAGTLTQEGDKKILKSYVNFTDLNFNDEKTKIIIKDYHVDGWTFTFRDETAKNLNNCPLSAPCISIVTAPEILNLSSDNTPSTETLEVRHAPKIKDLEGIDSFKNLKKVILGPMYPSIQNKGLDGLHSVAYCPPNIELRLDCLSNLKSLKGLPNNLKSLTITKTELEEFDCSNTTIDGNLVVITQPKTIKGLPKAKSYNITGFTDEQIQEELRFGNLRNKLPELEGIF